MTRAIVSLAEPCDIRQDVAGRTPPTCPGPERAHRFPGWVAGATTPTRPRCPVRIACRVIRSMKRASAGGEDAVSTVACQWAGIKAVER